MPAALLVVFRRYLIEVPRCGTATLPQQEKNKPADEQRKR
jgi:hypothetical protein